MKVKVTGGSTGPIVNNGGSGDIVQNVGSIQQGGDAASLAVQLGELKDAVLQNASEPEHYIAVSKIAEAKKAAEAGDKKGALQHLKTAGAWIWDVTQKVAVAVVVKAMMDS